jgi:hypothetical protein
MMEAEDPSVRHSVDCHARPEEIDKENKNDR